MILWLYLNLDRLVVIGVLDFQSSRPVVHTTSIASSGLLFIFSDFQAIIPTTNPTKDPIGKAVTTSASGSTTTNLRGDFNAEIRYFLHFLSDMSQFFGSDTETKFTLVPIL